MYTVLALEAGRRDPALFFSGADKPPPCKQNARHCQWGKSERVMIQLTFDTRGTVLEVP